MVITKELTGAHFLSIPTLPCCLGLSVLGPS